MLRMGSAIANFCDDNDGDDDDNEEEPSRVMISKRMT